MKTPSMKTLMFLKLLTRAKHGTVSLILPDGKKGNYGFGEPVIHVHVKEWSAIDLLFSKGDLGLAEAIIDDTIVVDNFANLVEWACQNDQDLGQALHGSWYGRLAAKLKHFLSRNDPLGAQRSMRVHYDIGSEFYRLWLDPSMTYSSAIFSDPRESLKEAQINKYNRIIRALDLKPQDHLLEIGCGWGGFFQHVATQVGCKITAVTNSAEETRQCRNLIEEKKIADKVTLINQDFSQIEGTFDKIVSIEMFESVGEKNWESYFQKLKESIKPQGLILLQGTTIREDLFYSHRKGTNFIQQYIFPGGTLPAPSTFHLLADQFHMRVVGTFEFGASYAETIKIWRNNFAKSHRFVQEMGFDEKFIRLWDLYLAYCEGALRANSISVGQFLLQPQRKES